MNNWINTEGLSAISLDVHPAAIDRRATGRAERTVLDALNDLQWGGARYPAYAGLNMAVWKKDSHPGAAQTLADHYMIFHALWRKPRPGTPAPGASQIQDYGYKPTWQKGIPANDGRLPQILLNDENKRTVYIDIMAAASLNIPLLPGLHAVLGSGAIHYGHCAACVAIGTDVQGQTHLIHFHFVPAPDKTPEENGRLVQALFSPLLSGLRGLHVLLLPNPDSTLFTGESQLQTAWQADSVKILPRKYPARVVVSEEGISVGRYHTFEDMDRNDAHAFIREGKLRLWDWNGNELFLTLPHGLRSAGSRLTATSS